MGSLRLALKESAKLARGQEETRVEEPSRTVEEMWHALDVLAEQTPPLVTPPPKKKKQRLIHRGLPLPETLEWDRDCAAVGCEGLRKWRHQKQKCVVVGHCVDDEFGQLYLCADAGDGRETVMDPIDTAETIRRCLVGDVRRERGGVAVAADRRAAEEAIEAAHAAARERDYETWETDCACGMIGKDLDDGTDMLQCTLCFKWAHSSCAANSLKGNKLSQGRNAFTGPLRYCCHSCRPARYLAVSDVQTSPAVVVDAPCSNNHNLDDEDDLFLHTRSVSRHKGLEVYLRRDASYRDHKIVDEILSRPCAYERPTLYVGDVVPGSVDCLNFEIVPGERWLDAGAHAGYFTSLALYTGASVVAVEPDPDNFKVLTKNGRRNTSPGTSFFPLQAAIGSSQLLYLHPSNIAFRHSTHDSRRQKGWRSIAVNSVSLQTILDTHGPFDGVKIDCQGAEIEAVDSVTDWTTVSKLVLEYDFEYAPSLAHFHAFVKRLKKHFALVSHPKLKAVGNFVGFPNGIIVFALRRPPQTLNPL